jgi:hypothetical protein
MSGLVLALPVLPGKSELWRRAIQEMLDSRLGAYEASRQAQGVTREIGWLAQTHQGEIVFLYLETADTLATLARLAESGEAFDCWFRQQLHDINGVDLKRPAPGWPGELIHEWPGRHPEKN